MSNIYFVKKIQLGIQFHFCRRRIWNNKLPVTIVIFTTLWFMPFSHAQESESNIYKKYSTGRFVEILKTFQTADYAVGIQAKGKLANVVTNFGQISNFHVFAPSLEWPAFGEGQDDEQQYGFGVDFMIGIDGDVIESFQDPASNIISREWQPVKENLYSGNVTVSETDQTPILATSDNLETWPIDTDGNPFWPGMFRRDSLGIIYPGEFPSERDIYCVFNDDGNDTKYGLRVELTTYSFARRYAEDFLVYRFNIKNTSLDTLRNIYPGMMVQFLIDFDNFDLINFIDSNNDGERDLVSMWDSDGLPQEPWSKVGYIGLVVVSSPRNNGITNFHFFHDEFTPSKDEDFWTLLTSDTVGLPDTIRARYFHGDDVRIDDVSFAPQLDPDGLNRGGEITWAYSVGPVSIAPGDSIPLDIAIVCGDDEEDLLDNVEWVWFLAGNNWNGSNPPQSPEVKAYAGDGKVTVTWDADRAENSRDNVNGMKDFEGYKIYRSIDQGKTWGKIITNSVGDFIAFKPIAQYDLVNGITGDDPISGKYLGNDSGIKHTFVDSTVSNGVEYWYTVTAYDRGDAVNGVESLESALGLTVDEINIESARPAKAPSNINQGGIAGENMLQPIEGKTNGIVSIEILDERLLMDRNYEITFLENTIVFENDVPIDTIKTFTLKNVDSGEILLLNHPLTDNSGDNVPVIDGFRLSVKDVEPGKSFAGWTKYSGDSCNYDWYFDNHGLANYFPAEIVGIGDFKLVVSYSDSSEVRVVTVGDSTINGIGGVIFADVIKVPVKAYDITDPSNPIDITQNLVILDFAYWFPSQFFGPKGWDLNPGGKGYNPTPGVLQYPDELHFLSSPSVNPLLPDSSLASVRTQNFDSMEIIINGQTTTIPGIQPMEVDEYSILTRKPFNNNVIYRFSTTASQILETTADQLENIRVVPNPYFVTSAFDDRIMFTNLPDRCEIKIFNVSGDIIRKLSHEEDTGAAFWDLKNDAGLAVAYGLYVYTVETDNGKKHMGKFSIIR
jgi:hypothetical protein